MFTSLLLLKGPSKSISLTMRTGSVGGLSRKPCLRGLVARDSVDVRRARSSGEYTGGLDFSTDGIIRGGNSAFGLTNNGF